MIQKYIDEGKLVVKSGQTAFEQVATANWDLKSAEPYGHSLLQATILTGRS
ncbi:hypothetical protein [Enterocloster sp.]|uniref:hypothetical protein n=1 Tax=Enterocloster sp. TaxID=2719315 RepID=UPI0039A26349